MKDLGYFALCLGIGAMVGLVYERGKIVGKTELAEQAVEAFGKVTEIVEEATEKVSEV